MSEIRHVDVPQELNELSREIVDCAYHVHKTLGPGLLERFYRDCLVIELKNRGLKVEKEVAVPVVYKGILLEGMYVIDLIVEEKIVLELKTVNEIAQVHKSQLLTYLKLSDKRLGILINFNTALIKDGIRRIVN